MGKAATIKPSEFRLGNYVMDAISGEWMVVDELGENIGAVLINRDKYPLPGGWQMAPIPLTADTIQKMGFKKCSCGGYKVNKFHLDKDFMYNNKVKLHNLHQLQNLYHLLTGEELI